MITVVAMNLSIFFTHFNLSDFFFCLPNLFYKDELYYTRVKFSEFPVNLHIRFVVCGSVGLKMSQGYTFRGNSCNNLKLFTQKYIHLYKIRLANKKNTAKVKLRKKKVEKFIAATLLSKNNKKNKNTNPISVF